MTEFPDPALLDPAERIAAVNALRLKQQVSQDQGGPDLTDDELSYALRLIRVQRAGVAAAKGRKAPAPAPTDLSSF